MRGTYGVAWLAGLLLCAACQAPPATSTSASTGTEPIVRSGVLLGATVLRTPTSVQGKGTPAKATDAYTLAWGQAMGSANGFDSYVGAAVLADVSETAQTFCADKALQFDVKATTVLYCRTAHEGPDRLPQAGMILIPSDAYQAALPQDDDNGTGMALVVAMAYAQHVTAELVAHHFVNAEQTNRGLISANCVAGLSLRAYASRMTPAAWDKVLAFASTFTVANAPAWDRQQLFDGYNSGQLADCLR